jgi:hypothetical protein
MLFFEELTAYRICATTEGKSAVALSWVSDAVGSTCDLKEA